MKFALNRKFLPAVEKGNSKSFIFIPNECLAKHYCFPSQLMTAIFPIDSIGEKDTARKVEA